MFWLWATEIFCQQSKYIFDFKGSRFLNNKIVQTHLNFDADIIMMGHADSVSIETIKI